jgi:hypothetical protein
MKTTLDFADLLDFAVMRQFVADAKSIAQRERWAWYELWLPHFACFHRAVQHLARKLDREYWEVREVALGGLFDIYRDEKSRIARRRARQQ